MSYTEQTLQDVRHENPRPAKGRLPAANPGIAGDITPR